MIKVALIGCGMMGNCHSNSYKSIEDAKVVAVCDLDYQKAEKIAKVHGARIYTDVEELYKNEKVDMIDLCLPTYLHCKFAVQAMQKKIHVFCEKPIATSVEEGMEMIKVAKEEGVKFSVGHVVRFFPAYESMIESIRAGKVGEPRLIRTTRNGSFPKWSWEKWYGNYHKSGGPLMDLAIHDFDWISHYYGEVERVYAKTLKGAAKEQDHCLVTLRLKNGLIAHVEASWGYPDGAVFGTTVEVVGTTGQIEYDSRKSSPVKKHSNEGHYAASLYSPTNPNYEPYTREIKAFISAVIHNEEPVVKAEEALTAIKIALAAKESDCTGEAIIF